MDKKKIIIVASISLQEQVLHNRLTPFFNEFLATGIEVIFICPKSKINLNKISKNVKLVEVETKESKANNYIKRALKEANNTRKLLKKAKSLNANYYLLTMPSMFFAFLSPFYLKNKNVFLDCRDLTWEYLLNKNIIHKISRSILTSWFKKNINFFKGIFTTNETDKHYIDQYIKKKEKSLLVLNGISKFQFDSLSNMSISKNKRLNVTYIGNIGIAQHLKTLIYVAKQLPDVDFTLVGSGIEYEYIENLLKKLSLKNVELVGRVEWENVYSYYENADILYAQLSHSFSRAVPSKIYEYLATGKYIIYGGEQQAIKSLSAFFNHKVIPPCDVEALKNAISSFSIENRKICNYNRDIIKERYIREDSAKKLVEYILKNGENIIKYMQEAL